MPPANTDNMGKLFVTVFANRSCTQDSFVTVHAPGHAHLHAIKILYRDRFPAPRQIVPRHCTSAPNNNPVP